MIETGQEAAAGENGKYKWTVVGMLWFICFFNYADRQAISSILPILERDYHIDKQQQGLIVSAFTVIYALSAPFAGSVVDKFARKGIILAGLYVWSIVTGFTAVCSKWWQFVVVRGAEGLGETFYFPATMSLISDYHGSNTRSRAMSLHQTSVYAGTIGGGWFAGYMAQRGHWSASFVILAIAGVLLGLLLAAFIKEPRRSLPEISKYPLDLTKDDAQNKPAEHKMSALEFLSFLLACPPALFLMAAFFGANLVAFLFLAWSPTFLGEKYKLGLAQAGLSGTFFIQVGSMIGSTLGGVLADKWRQRSRGGRIFVQAVGAIAGAPFIFLFGYTKDITVVLLAMSFFGLFKGLYDANIWASLYDVVPAERRGTAVGVMNMIGWSGAAIGAYSLGALVNAKTITMSVGFSGASVLYIFTAALLVAAGTFHTRQHNLPELKA